MNFNSIYCGNAASSNPSKLGICQRRTSRQRTRYEIQERRRWRERNHGMIKELSHMIGVWPEDIDDFLYDLTLKKYSHLLNPKECGWSFCHVPLCYPNVCDRYMGIFDHYGNLKDPTHPKCLHHLLQLLQDYLNGACHNCCLGLPIHAEYSGGRPFSDCQFRKPFNYHDPEMEVIDGNSLFMDLKNSLDTSFQMPKRKSPPRIESPVYSPISSPRMTIDRPYNINQTGDDDPRFRSKLKRIKGRSSVFLNDELALAHNRSHIYMEQLVSKTLVRPHNKNSFVGPIGNLRNERIRILIKQLILKKGRRFDPDELNRIIEKVDIGPHMEQKRQKQIALEISRLYNNVVQRKSSDKNKVAMEISQMYTDITAKKTHRRGHKYIAEQVPILFHAPFDENKPWTWQHRHPGQLRVTAENKIGNSHIKRYHPDWIKNKLIELKKQISIHSLYSVREEAQPMFG
ncbi:hypothetical protein KR200_005786, partial [Drosophila serrata]